MSERPGLTVLCGLAHQMTGRESPLLFMYIINSRTDNVVHGYFTFAVHLPELRLLDWVPLLNCSLLYGGTDSYTSTPLPTAVGPRRCARCWPDAVRRCTSDYRCPISDSHGQSGMLRPTGRPVPRGYSRLLLFGH